MHSNSPRKNGREVLQKGKNGKRRKEWHHGTVEATKWQRDYDALRAALERAGLK